MGLRAIRSAVSSSGRTIALRYLFLATAANLVWEVAQLPLYTIGEASSTEGLAYVVAHCTAGDVIILAAALLLALVLAGDGAWPERGCRSVTVASTFIGVAYTIFSEWLNVHVLQNWAYAPAMPLVPPFGTGLSPLLQWLLIPPAALMVM
ncbi:MAG TPA: hypothetical protein VGU20_01390 [Stellaceae bacterium]|nr:hypothetical protein [Stellaceae bacterium]